MWGHSGGGFITADAMFRYPDFFKVGISESGNHDQRLYEDDWGERYQGLLHRLGGEHKGSGTEPRDSYEAEANQTLAKNLKGKLFLMHGMMDDNVPPQNTYVVVDALIKANKDFDLLLLPHQRHGFGVDGPYVMRRRWDYFVRHLLGVEPPRRSRARLSGMMRACPPGPSSIASCATSRSTPSRAKAPAPTRARRASWCCCGRWSTSCRPWA
jgi:dipeptidyl-peptidase-4